MAGAKSSLKRGKRVLVDKGPLRWEKYNGRNCDVSGCERKATRKGLCGLHYERLRRTGKVDNPPVVRVSNKGMKCSVEGCCDKPTRKMLCNKHYARLRATGKTDDPVRMVRLCSIPGCGRPHNAYGLCGNHRERQKRYGNPLAAAPWVARICAYCGSEFRTMLDGQFCSENCSRRARGGVPLFRACVICGRSYPVINGKVTCSPECQAERRYRTQRNHHDFKKQTTEYLERRRIAQQRRRVRKIGGRVEAFSFQDVFARDNGRCGICGESVDVMHRSPHPMSGTIDHIMPICLGGEHIWSNVRLAHRRCNMKKSGKHPSLVA